MGSSLSSAGLETVGERKSSSRCQLCVILLIKRCFDNGYLRILPFILTRSADGRLMTKFISLPTTIHLASKLQHVVFRYSPDSFLRCCLAPISLNEYCTQLCRKCVLNFQVVAKAAPLIRFTQLCRCCLAPEPFDPVLCFPLNR